MTPLCHQHIHLIAQLPTGRYACSYCGQQFAEYHEVHLTVGTGATPALPTPKAPESEVRDGPR